MNASAEEGGSRRSPSLLLVSGFLAAVVLVYAVAVVLGIVSSDSRLGVAEVALLTLAGLFVLAALNPGLLKWMRTFEAFGIRIERIEAEQVTQSARLESLRVILPLLLPPREQRHLTNLADSTTGNYVGRESLRHEIRRLRGLELITMVDNRRVGEIENRAHFDLAEFVALTDLGREWVARIRELEAHDAQKSGGKERLPSPSPSG